MEQEINEENIENNLVFCIDARKVFAINQYQDLFVKIRYIRTKYVYFLFRSNFDFGFFIKPWRNRLCIWIISQERVDLACIISVSLPYKLTTVGEVWWPLQWNRDFNSLLLCHISLYVLSTFRSQLITIFLFPHRFLTFQRQILSHK